MMIKKGLILLNAWMISGLIVDIAHGSEPVNGRAAIIKIGDTEFYSPVKKTLCAKKNGNEVCVNNLDTVRITIDGRTFELHKKFGIVEVLNETH